MWSSFPKTESGALLQQWKPVAVLSLSLPSGLTVGDTVTQFGLRAQNKAATSLLIETLLVQPNLLLESVFMRGTESGTLESFYKTVITTCLLQSRLNKVDSEKNRWCFCPCVHWENGIAGWDHLVSSRLSSAEVVRSALLSVTLLNQEPHHVLCFVIAHQLSAWVNSSQVISVNAETQRDIRGFLATFFSVKLLQDFETLWSVCT